MSRITNAILTTHVTEDIELVNRFLQVEVAGGGGSFVDVSNYAGGYKHMECHIYISAFNHADTDVIIKAVKQAPWRDRQMVQLFVKEQEEELFRLRWCGSDLS